MRTVKLLLLATIFSVVSGQLIRINITQTTAITVSDVFVLIANIAFYAQVFRKRLPIKLSASIHFSGALFIIAAIASSIFALNFFTNAEVITASMFILRLFLYFSLSVIFLNLTQKQEAQNYIKTFLFIGILFATIGLSQFIFFPDLSSLQLFGWDPHAFRLVSTTLDPNYTGMMLTFFSALSTSLFLYKKEKKYLLFSLIFTICLLLTFSRSSYLAYLVSMASIGLIKSPKVIVLALLLFISSFIFVKQTRERIAGAFRVDETATARIESWQKAITIYKDNPLFGVGFNNYRNAQGKYGFFQSDGQMESHSGGGSDSTFLLVAATTGTVGLTFYVIWQLLILKQLARGLSKNYLSLALFSSYVALLVHTQFVNSLLFPQIMVMAWPLIGIHINYEN